MKKTTTIKGDGAPHVAAQSGGEKADSKSLMTKKRTGDLSIPYAEASTVESIATGFRQQMFDLRDKDGHGGSVAIGAGWGSDFITLEWGEHRAIVRGIDLLRAYVATVDPEAVKGFPEGLS